MFIYAYNYLYAHIKMESTNHYDYDLYISIPAEIEEVYSGLPYHSPEAELMPLIYDEVLQCIFDLSDRRKPIYINKWEFVGYLTQDEYEAATDIISGCDKDYIIDGSIERTIPPHDDDYLTQVFKKEI